MEEEPVPQERWSVVSAWVLTTDWWWLSGCSRQTERRATELWSGSRHFPLFPRPMFTAERRLVSGHFPSVSYELRSILAVTIAAIGCRRIPSFFHENDLIWNKKIQVECFLLTLISSIEIQQQQKYNNNQLELYAHICCSFIMRHDSLIIKSRYSRNPGFMLIMLVISRRELW